MGKGAGGQTSPQFGLPMLLLAALPPGNPIRAIDQVLIEQVGDPHGEGKARAVVPIRTIGMQRRKARALLYGPPGAS